MNETELSYNVDGLRNALGANVTDLSNALGVTRQAVYSWLKGKGMTRENLAKLNDLAKAAYIFDEARIRPNSYMLNRPILDGRSFVQAVRRAPCSEMMARRVVEVMRRESQQRALMARLLDGRPSPEFSEAGIPHLDEDAQ
jgi:transcriptional regulator with XRE-family HTH domain